MNDDNLYKFISDSILHNFLFWTEKQAEYRRFQGFISEFVLILYLHGFNGRFTGWLNSFPILNF